MSETSGTERTIPTLYDWLGGIEPLNRLTIRFYEHVKADMLLAPIFAHMSPEHPGHVAAFLAEVLGGPTGYSEHHGGHPHMIRQHLNRHLTQDQRQRWVPCCWRLRMSSAFRMTRNSGRRWSDIWSGARGSPSSIPSPALRRKKTRLCPNGAGAR